MALLSVEDALKLVLADVGTLEAETISLWDGLGRVLAADIIANDDLPPFDNSSMDGYAVIAEDVANASSDNPVTLDVIEDIPAGKAPTQTLRSGQAARIMTGAPMPQGANTVVPVEKTDDERRLPQAPPQIKIFEGSQAGDYVRPIGEDVQNNQVILKAGQLLRPADLGVLAGLGYPQVEVVQKPKVAIISTGDELLTPEQPLEAGKIRDMNSYTLSALVTELGAEPIWLGIARDTEADVESRLKKAVELGANLILSSAGVSVGAFDFVKTVLEKLGAVNFWKINMRPGKPLTFGHVQGVPFLGLPGNPVSSMVTFEVFARPMIKQMLGLPIAMTTQTAVVGETISSDGRMTFARVILKQEAGERYAYVTGTQSSGAISSMVKADGLLVIPAGRKEVHRGERLSVRIYDKQN